MEPCIFFYDIITDFKTKSAIYNTRSFSSRKVWTHQLVTHYFLMWVHRNAKIDDFQEYFDMLMVLGECRKHYRNAQDLYAARYPDRQQKSHMALKRLADRFWRFGTVKQTRVKRRSIVNENNAAAILAFAALDSNASSRQMEKKSGISQQSVLRILHHTSSIRIVYHYIRMCTAMIS